MEELSFAQPPIDFHLDLINEPQLHRLQTAIYHTGLDVKNIVIQYAGHISAKTRLHQLHWGDRKGAYYNK